MWRFVHLSDPHLGSQTDGRWNNAFLCTMMPEVMSCLRRDLRNVKPEFLLATGDIASKQTRDAVFAARDLMDSLGVDYFPMGGNHDFVLEESRDWFIEAFQGRLPNYDTVYSFDWKNLHFCVLDPWWQWPDGTLSPVNFAHSNKSHDDTSLAEAKWAIPPHQLAWLEDDLRKHDDKPSIIATHYPAVPIPERLCRPDMKNAGCLENGFLLIELLEGYEHAKAVFAGHVHMHFIHKTGGIHHVVTGALPEYPVEYRTVDVYDDKLEIRTRRLSDKTFAQRSLLPGKEWVAGEEQDRTATVPLV